MIEVSAAGFPTAWKIMENLENEKKHFPDLEKSWNLTKRPKSWKNHGILKYLYRKIMESCTVIVFFQTIEGIFS